MASRPIASMFKWSLTGLHVLVSWRCFCIVYFWKDELRDLWPISGCCSTNIQWIYGLVRFTVKNISLIVSFVPGCCSASYGGPLVFESSTNNTNKCIKAESSIEWKWKLCPRPQKLITTAGMLLLSGQNPWWLANFYTLMKMKL